MNTTEEEALDILRWACGGKIPDYSYARLTYDRGPYDLTTPTPLLMNIIDIARKTKKEE